MQVPRVRAGAKGECREGHGRESTRRDALHHTCTFVLFDCARGTRALFLVVRGPAPNET